MFQKILSVLLTLSLVFGVTGFSQVVLAYVSTSEPITDQATANQTDNRKEVRLVVIPSEKVESTPAEDEKDSAEEKDEEDKEVEAVPEIVTEETKSSSNTIKEKEIDSAVAETIEQIEAELAEKIEKPPVVESSKETATEKPRSNTSEVSKSSAVVPTVPFFSQFTDITSTKWQKVSCGIAGVAMLVDFYKPGVVSADKLLQEGISAGAYLSNAGWTHQGLIDLSKQFGLDGRSHSLSGLSMDKAFSTLVSVLKDGPVMASVHYTFDPANPIPHLVVINGVKDGKVFYNDPAEKTGGGSISIAKFQSAWKKRYIEIRPVG